MKVKKKIPFQFVLDELELLAPTTRSMFGCTAVYVHGKIVLALREKEEAPECNGVWIATTKNHHSSLKQELPSMTSISLFGSKTSSWQMLSDKSSDFEEAVLRACQLILRRDPRIGTGPK